MPRKAAVNHEQLLPILLDSNNVIDQYGNIPGPTNKVWKEISEKIDFKLKPNYIYQQIKENRYGLYSKLRNKIGLFSPAPSVHVTDDKEFYERYESCTEPSSDDNEEESPIKPKRTFKVTIPSLEWDQLKPIKTKYRRKERGSLREMWVLPPYKWESVLMELLWDQHKLPCPYRFLYSKVSTERTEREQYIQIKASCSECKAEAEGKIFAEPLSGEIPVMDWRCDDTRSLAHTTKRWLTGEKMKAIGMSLMNKSSTTLRSIMANRLMDSNDLEPPNLYKDTTLRKVKQETKDLSSDVVHGSDPIICLELMKHSYPHCGSIHDIGQDKFFVHYFSHSQMEIFKSFSNKNYTSVSIDATGSLVKQILRTHGPSSHIFLYEVVMHNGSSQIPILQMLSEKQDGNSILYWLNEWQRAGAPTPNEVVIDNSGALKSAISRSFAKCSDITNYKEKCFAVLRGLSLELPSCYIRLDVAHLMKGAATWSVWREKSSKRLKEFYLRCLGLLVVSSTLLEFKSILMDILTISLSEEEGTEAENSAPHAVEASLNALKERVKGFPSAPPLQKFNSDVLLPLFHNEDSQFDQYHREGNEESFLHEESFQKIKNATKSSLVNWIHEIQDEATQMAITKGDRLNPYYQPDVANNFVRLAADFPLWTAVMKDPFKSPNLTATSTSVESDFNNLKHKILMGDVRPMHIHKMVDRHLNYIYGYCKIVNANLSDKKNPNLQLEIPSINKIACEQLTCIDPLVDSDNCTSELNDLSEREYKCEKDDTEDVEKPIDFRNDGDASQNLDVEGHLTETRPGKRQFDDNAFYEDQEKNAPFDLNCFENWRGKTTVTSGIAKKAKYINSSPEFETVLSARSIKTPSKPLLINGSKEPFIMLDNKKVLVKNTCNFDAPVTAISSAYIQFGNYRDYVDKSSNMMLKTAKSLAIFGATKETYKLRAETLVTIFPPVSKLPMLRLPGKKQLPSLEYDTWANVTTTVTQLLQDSPSAVLHSKCTNVNCRKNETTTVVCLDCNMNIISTKGLHALTDAMSASFRSKSVCSTCGSFSTLTVNGQAHLIVDLDFMGQELPLTQQKLFNRPHELAEIPLSLDFYEKNYLLMGIVTFSSGHYVCYIRRHASESWDLHNDLSKKVKHNVSSKTEVIPHMLIYAAALGDK